MKILVTGGAGFIGSNFISRALAEGHTIINIDKLTYAGKLENLSEVASDPHYTFYKMDICETNAIGKILCDHKPEALLHMAAESHVDRSIDSSREFIHTNINGTHSLLEAARHYLHQFPENSFRFVHLSTDEVFGALGDEGSFCEDSCYRPNSPYAASKASSDMLVRAYAKTYSLPTIIANTCNNFGPKQYPEKLIPVVILNALEGRELPIYGAGKQIREWLYVEDHVSALMKILTIGRIGETYCVGSGNEMTNLEMVEAICGILDETRPDKASYKDLICYVKDRPGHDYRYAINSNKIRTELGWEPKWTFYDALKATVIWYVHHFSRLRSVSRKRIGTGEEGSHA